MKLKFEKNEAQEIIVSADGENFVSQNYIDLIKQLHAGKKLEVEFEEGLTDAEKQTIIKMVETINSLDTETGGSDFKPINEVEKDDDLPF